MREREMLLLRDRYRMGAGFTGSRLYIDEGGYLCDILEPEDRGLTQDMPLSVIKQRKVKGKTAIPVGRYEVIWSWSKRLHDKSYAIPYDGKFPCIIGTPGFSGVLFHPGNKVADTEACLLPGIWVPPQSLRDSVKAYRDLMDYYLVPSFERKDRVWLTIDYAPVK
ncbi:MAG: DUF5675 family protein [Bacteroidales bacterium]|nr:DUF5675 family protein [Bacteroidales bacterium]